MNNQFFYGSHRVYMFVCAFILQNKFYYCLKYWVIIIVIKIINIIIIVVSVMLWICKSWSQKICCSKNSDYIISSEIRINRYDIIISYRRMYITHSGKQDWRTCLSRVKDTQFTSQSRKKTLFQNTKKKFLSRKSIKLKQ